MGWPVEFSGEVVLVTGGSRGLGAAFSRFLASAGAHVAINSTGRDDGARKLAAELNAAGHRATAVNGAVEDAAALVEATIARCGGLHAIVHNAGFVQDKTLRKMTDAQWDAVLDVHLKAGWALSRAAWPTFEANGYGRVVLISSSAGLYGNFGQSNYAAAKMGMYGLCRAMALEGEALDIGCNCVAPFGATTMNNANMTDEFQREIRTDYVAPIIGYLAHAACRENGGLFEASAGSFKKLRWERGKGLRLPRDQPMTLAAIAAGWDDVVSFAATEHPRDMREALRGLYEE
ncbi:MAG: SDR family NAD(P)-dependent oxidoreductase [Pseudomonadota bacterium]